MVDNEMSKPSDKQSLTNTIEAAKRAGGSYQRTISIHLYDPIEEG